MHTRKAPPVGERIVYAVDDMKAIHDQLAAIVTEENATRAAIIANHPAGTPTPSEMPPRFTPPWQEPVAIAGYCFSRNN